MLIDSVPPATTALAKPHMMRSPAYAMAWRPDEQNRLMVTADASTGMPARRLAMRATLSPCSASGIAHPRITSSISAGETPGARFSASPMQTAASSSGRVDRRDPDGALPTAVRTAETITASAIVILQQIFDRIAHFGDLGIEEMIRAVDHHQLLWLGQPAGKLPH